MKFKRSGNIDYFDRLVWICVFYFLYKLSILTVVNAWDDRSLFFNDGLYSPNLLDILINELLFSLILGVVILGRFRWVYFIFVLIGSVVYFTRAGIMLYLIACMFSGGISYAIKAKMLCFASVASLLILVIRFGGNIPNLDELFLFYVDYPLIGIGRLLVTEHSNSVDGFGVLTLFFRPLGILTFLIDYSFTLSGSFSIERFAGKLLSDFVYIPLIGDHFNAFGTILFPYFIAFGRIEGLLVFFLTIVFFFYVLCVIFDVSVAGRFCFFLMFSGLLFSWNAPFIWIAPFICRFLFGRRAYQPFRARRVP
jgi:hypothetical protein